MTPVEVKSYLILKYGSIDEAFHRMMAATRHNPLLPGDEEMIQTYVRLFIK